MRRQERGALAETPPGPEAPPAPSGPPAPRLPKQPTVPTQAAIRTTAATAVKYRSPGRIDFGRPTSFATRPHGSSGSILSGFVTLSLQTPEVCTSDHTAVLLEIGHRNTATGRFEAGARPIRVICC